MDCDVTAAGVADGGWACVRDDGHARALVSPDGRAAWAIGTRGGETRLALFAANRLVCEMTGDRGLLESMAAAYEHGGLAVTAFVSLDTGVEQWCDAFTRDGGMS